CCLLSARPPRSPLFPYTTLFRSSSALLRSLWERIGVCRLLRFRGGVLLGAIAPILLHRADNALGQEQSDCDEEAAQRIEPELGESAGEEALASVYKHRADDRPDQRAASPDSGPDNHLDGVG